MFEQFQKFATRDDVVDLATGVIIGASFTSIVNSIAKDIVNPPRPRGLRYCMNGTATILAQKARARK